MRSPPCDQRSMSSERKHPKSPERPLGLAEEVELRLDPGRWTFQRSLGFRVSGCRLRSLGFLGLWVWGLRVSGLGISNGLPPKEAGSRRWAGLLAHCPCHCSSHWLLSSPCGKEIGSECKQELGLHYSIGLILRCSGEGSKTALITAPVSVNPRLRLARVSTKPPRPPMSQVAEGPGHANVDGRIDGIADGLLHLKPLRSF